MRHAAKTDAAHAERAHIATRATAQLATVLLARLELGVGVLALGFDDFSFFSHDGLLVLINGCRAAWLHKS